MSVLYATLFFPVLITFEELEYLALYQGVDISNEHAFLKIFTQLQLHWLLENNVFSGQLQITL